MSDPKSDFEAHLSNDKAVFVAADGQVLPRFSERCPIPHALLPGSFNPVHEAHWQLARIAESILGAPVAFELSVANVDKSPLTVDEIRLRLAPFQWQASVWVTAAPRFVNKAALFPGATFVIGADTALRLVAPRYYGNDVQAMGVALAQIQAAGCCFLVACRVDEHGKCWERDDLPIPAEFGGMFAAIPVDRFRFDMSSSRIRLGTER